MLIQAAKPQLFSIAGRATDPSHSRRVAAGSDNSVVQCGQRFALARDSHRAGRAFFLVGFFFGGLPQFVDCADEQKNCAGYDEKVDHERDKVPIIPSDRSGFQRISGRVERGRAVSGGSQDDELVREIKSAGEKTNRRHEHIFDQRIDDRTEGRPDDYADGEIDSVTFDGEFLEFIPDLLHKTMLTSFLTTTITLRTVLPAIRP
jgi:hypothetical protein